MSIKLYTDKSEIFECNVSLEGASIKDSKLRAILKFDDKNLMIEGKIKSNGKGEIIFQFHKVEGTNNKIYPRMDKLVKWN